MLALSLASDQILQGAQRNKLTTALAPFHDSADAKLGIKNLDGVADLGMLGLSKKIVHQHIVGRLERTSCKVAEAADMLS